MLFAHSHQINMSYALNSLTRLKLMLDSMIFTSFSTAHIATGPSMMLEVAVFTGSADFVENPERVV